MNKIITFIILAYNVEQYLHKCLDSFLCESVLEQIEVIVVDDGSKDRTAEIADDYVRRYPQTFRVIHKENGGHGSGINAGSQAAKGKFMKPVDADDWVVTENLPAFVEQLAQCNADVVLTPFHMVDMTTGKKTAKNIQGWKTRSVHVTDILENWAVFEDCCVFHGITYKTEFYRAGGHMLPEHVFYEDQEYNAIPFCRATTIDIFDLYIYQYLVGNAQQSISYGNQAKRIDHVETVAWDLVAYYKTESDLSVSAREYLLAKIKSVSLIYFATAFIYEADKKKGRQHGKQFGEALKKRIPEVYRTIQKQYNAFQAMNYVCVSPEFYQKLVQSGGYKNLKNTVKGVFQKK